MSYSEKCQAQARNEQIDFGAENAAQQLNKAIEEFFLFANAHDYQQVNNDMLSSFIELAFIEDEEIFHSKEYIKRVMVLAGFQNKFLTQLKETWELTKKFPTLKTAQS